MCGVVASVIASLPFMLPMIFFTVFACFTINYQVTRVPSSSPRYFIINPELMKQPRAMVLDTHGPRNSQKGA